MNKFPEHIMQILREDLNYKTDLLSIDMEINLYSPNEAFKKVLAYREGIDDYYPAIKKYINDIYGIDLDSISNAKDKEWEEQDGNEWYKHKGDIKRLLAKHPDSNGKVVFKSEYAQPVDNGASKFKVYISKLIQRCFKRR